jgi:hypothetical protein
MIYIDKFLLSMLPLIALSVGCTSSPHRTNEPQQSNVPAAAREDGRSISNSVAVEAKAQSFVDIEFDPGSSQLTDNAKSSLDSIIKMARHDGIIDEMIVLSWSDEEYPSKRLSKLSKSQIRLADNRNVTIERYVKSIKGMSVDSYNMAKRPDTLSKWFNTSDSKLKNSLLAAGLPTTADSNQYPSKASHSVILIKME